MSQTECHDDEADESRPIAVEAGAEAARRCADLLENAAKMLAGAERGLGEWTDSTARRLSHDGTVDAKAMFQDAIENRRTRIAKVAEDITTRAAAWLHELEECDEDSADLNWETNAEAS